MVRLDRCSTAVAFLLSIVLLLPLQGLHFVSAAHEQPYSVTVSARREIEGSDSGVTIYLDGLDSGFSTPHRYTGLLGFHNFSVRNEDATGHFIGGPPKFQSSADAGSSVLSEGVNWIVIGPPNAPNSEATIEFRYGSVPFLENFRDTFEPGTIARLGVRVHMDPTRVASGHVDVYEQGWPIDTSKTAPVFTSQFTVRGDEPAFVQFEIPKNASTGSWSYRIIIKDTNLNVSVNSSFDVAFRPRPASASFPTYEALPNATLDVEGTRYAFFGNPQATAVVLYVGGGTIGAIGGATPINGSPNIIDENSATYRLVYDLVANGFSVVTPSGPWQGLDFPSELIRFLRGQGRDTFYAIGHSAGGVVVANNLLTHPDLFGKAVIADAPLTKESTGFYFNDLSIRSESVIVPHLLLWGRGDAQAKLENAYAWMDHANQSLATLKVYDYGHDWAGTTAEIDVRNQILGFLKDKPSPTLVVNLQVGPQELAMPLVGALFDVFAWQLLQRQIGWIAAPPELPSETLEPLSRFLLW